MSNEILRWAAKHHHQFLFLAMQGNATNSNVFKLIVSQNAANETICLSLLLDMAFTQYGSRGVYGWGDGGRHVGGVARGSAARRLVLHHVQRVRYRRHVNHAQPHHLVLLHLTHLLLQHGLCEKHHKQTFTPPWHQNPTNSSRQVEHEFLQE